MNFAKAILKPVTVFLLTVCLSGLLGCGMSSSIPEGLELRLEEGNQLLMEQKLEVDQKVGNHPLHYKRFLIQSYEVIEGGKKGSYQVKVTWRRVQFRFPNTKRLHTIDSKYDSVSVDLAELEGQERIKAQVRNQLGLIGESYVVHLKPNRRAVRLEGFEQLGPSVIQKIRKNHSLSDEQAEFIKARFNLKSKLSDLNRSTKMFRKAKLEKGAKWDIEYKRHRLFPILVNQTYVYNGRSDTGIEFRAEGPVRVNSDQLPLKSDGWTVDYEAEGSQKQLIYLDPETGMKTSSRKWGSFQGSKTTTAPENAREAIKEMYPMTQDTFYRFDAVNYAYFVQTLTDEPPKFRKLSL